MQKFSLLILYSLITTTLFANDSIKSLHRSLNKAIKTNDTAAIVDAYKYLGDFLSETGDYEKSNIYLQNGLTLALDAKIYREVGVLFNLLATNASYEGKRELALSYYHRALKAFTEIKNLDKIALTLMNMGSEYESMGNYKFAIAYTLKAIKNKELSGVKKNLAYYYQHLGQLFKETDKQKWKFYVDKAYSIAKNSDEERMSTRVAIFNDLGGIAQYEKNYKQAYVWYDSMILISRANNYYNGLATAYSNRSHIFKLEKKYENALKDVLKAMEFAYQMDRNFLKITEHINAANLLIEMNRVSEAQRHATKALELASSLKTYPEEEASAHLALSIIGEKTGNWKLAYNHFKAHKEGIDSIRANDVQNTMHELELKYQTAAKEKEIARLDNENKLKSLKLQRAQILITSIVITVVLISLLVFVLYRRKQLKTQKLQAELKQKLLRSQMNPHFMFNTLNAINQYIQTKKGNEASDYLAQYSKLMRQILENSAVEFISLESEIDFLKNYLAMQQLRFGKSFIYNVVIDENINPELFEIPPMLAQPFIENAIEHGIKGIENGEINVKFGFKNKNLTLIVTDNGKGFQSENKQIQHKSFALDITRERLNISDNNTEKLKILSPNPQTGKGTLVKIDLPFKKYEE